MHVQCPKMCRAHRCLVVRVSVAKQANGIVCPVVPQGLSTSSQLLLVFLMLRVHSFSLMLSLDDWITCGDCPAIGSHGAYGLVKVLSQTFCSSSTEKLNTDQLLSQPVHLFPCIAYFLLQLTYVVLLLLNDATHQIQTL
jgi:hypothetical protein